MYGLPKHIPTSLQVKLSIELMSVPSKNTYECHGGFCMMRFPGERRIFCTGFRNAELSETSGIEFLFGLYESDSDVKTLPCTFFIDDYSEITPDDLETCADIAVNIESSHVLTQFEDKETSEDEHMAIVSDCVRYLTEISRDNDIDRKIVLARTKIINLTRNELSDIILNLFAKRQDALVFYYSIPEFGTWFGATPEILLTCSGHSISSMSLAGTRIIGTHQMEWDKKNIIEQRIVTDEIVSVFNQFGLIPRIDGPFSKQAGNVEHICSHIYTITPDTFTFQDILHLTKTLSPTPALCGFPRDMASEYIRGHELSYRECYGGFLGIHDFDRQNIKLYVNLRSGRYNPIDEKVKAYVGGGITPLSNPSEEVAETSRKLQWLTGYTRQRDSHTIDE